MDNTNALDQVGYDPKNRKVVLTVLENDIIVHKENVPHAEREFDTYEEADEYFDQLVTCSQN